MKLLGRLVLPLVPKHLCQIVDANQCVWMQRFDIRRNRLSRWFVESVGRDSGPNPPSTPANLSANRTGASDAGDIRL